MTPAVARAVAECNVAKAASAQGFRFFSQTVRKASEEKDLEDAQRKSEEDFERRAVQDAREDVEVPLTNTPHTALGLDC